MRAVDDQPAQGDSPEGELPVLQAVLGNLVVTEEVVDGGGEGGVGHTPLFQGGS